jgi:hypothetical protein
MWLLSQYSSQYCGVYTYILAVAEFSSSSINANRLCQLHPILSLFLVPNYLPLAHNLNSCYWVHFFVFPDRGLMRGIYKALRSPTFVQHPFEL